MRFRAAVLGAALLMLSAGAASAGSNYVGMTGGAGFPTGDYGDAAATGWNFGATGTHYVNDMWGFGADLCYHGWGGSEDANEAAELAFGPGSEFSFTALQAIDPATDLQPGSETLAALLEQWHETSGRLAEQIGQRFFSHVGESSRQTFAT